MSNFALIDNEEAKQYEIQIGDSIARIEYIKANDKIFLTHTEVPVALEGQGVASAIVKQVLEEVQKNDWTLVPMCPFVAGYIQRHPEWRSLVLKGIKIP